MRRLFALLLCLALFAFPVSASGSAGGLMSTAAVNADGSCQITLNMTLRLDQAVTKLTLPLAADVTDVRLNGARARTEKVGGLTGVKLDSILQNMAGQIPITVSFTVKNVVTTDEDGIQTVTVPLLQGLAYPIEGMSFTVTMPGAFTAEPVFLSGYYHQDIESYLTYRISGVTISGTVNTALKDHETLAMTLAAPEGMFPAERVLGETLSLVGLVMAVCALLGGVYWLAAMRARPRFPIRYSNIPEGVTAGVVGCYIVHTGADLSLMVMSWAQLGYLVMSLERSGAIVLHKRMDMGNERSPYEQKIFRSLFAKKDTVDATGKRFAALAEKTAANTRRMSFGLSPRSGNPHVLGALGSVIGAFAGIGLADCLVSHEILRGLVMAVLALALGFGAVLIRRGMSCLHLKDRRPLLLGLAVSGGMILAGLAAGCAGHMVSAVGLNLSFGWLSAYTGRRTETGNQIRDQLLGLRKHMCRAPRPDLERILRSNPDYYYQLAPYALAMGVDKKFAGRLGDAPLRECSWFLTGTTGVTTAERWYPLLRAAAEDMTAIQNRPFWEKMKKR